MSLRTPTMARACWWIACGHVGCARRQRRSHGGIEPPRRVLRYDDGSATTQPFFTRYRTELDANVDALVPLRELARAGPLTLLYGARDGVHNHAVVLAEYLREHLDAEKS